MKKLIIILVAILLLLVGYAIYKINSPPEPIGLSKTEKLALELTARKAAYQQTIDSLQQAKDVEVKTVYVQIKSKKVQLQNASVLPRAVLPDSIKECLNRFDADSLLAIYKLCLTNDLKGYRIDSFKIENTFLTNKLQAREAQLVLSDSLVNNWHKGYNELKQSNAQLTKKVKRARTGIVIAGAAGLLAGLIL